MKKTDRTARFITAIVGVAALAIAGLACADPPTRVARLSDIGGAVSFSPAGENDWGQATLNRPLVPGDRLWADGGARGELQAGSSVIRMGGATSVSVLNLDDNVLQLELTQGSVYIHVRRFAPDDVLEIDTPNLAFTVRQPGDYRIDVDPAGNATTVVTRAGSGEVYGEGAAYVVNAQTSYRFAGTGLRDYAFVAVPPPDELDRWAMDRDRRWERSASARYVSPEVIGYQDLDDNGTWRSVPDYGNVWVPNRVPTGWAPYRDGHWAWIDPWGWTWVDDAPWGFAVSHYGRWAYIGNQWGWVPGPVRARAVYAPALVAFVGGSNFQLRISSGNVGGIGWFPLGPRDVYRPTYVVSRGYFNNVNTSNTVINNTQITNVYNNRNVTNITYVNQQVPGAVVAVPATAFVQSQQVSRVAVPTTSAMFANAPVTAVAAIAPTQASVLGAGAAGSAKAPPPAVEQRRVVAKRAPPAAPVAFASKERELAANPGKPLDAAALAALKPATPAAAPKVQVIAPAQAPRPAAAPPEQGGKGEARGKGAERGKGNAPPPPGSTATTVPPAAAAAPVEADKRGKAEPRGKAGEPPAAAPPIPGAAPAPGASSPPGTPREPRGRPGGPPPAANAPPPPALPAGAPPDARGKADARGNNEPRDKGQPRGNRPPETPAAAPVAPAAAPVAPAAPPAAAPIAPQPAPPAGGAPRRGNAPERPAAQTPPPPAVQPPQPPVPLSGPAEAPRRPEARGRPVEPPAATMASPPAAAPTARPEPRGRPPEAPVAAPPEPRGRPAEPAAKPAAPPQPPAAMKAAPPQPPAATNAAPPQPPTATKAPPPPQPPAAVRAPAPPAAAPSAPPEKGAQRGNEQRQDAGKGGNRKSEEEQKKEDDEKKRKQ